DTNTQQSGCGGSALSLSLSAEINGELRVETSLF
ncbi:hypothetical protein CCACVL1_02038, partial [Corchorus capsularis]